jgi:hypothetical protein
MKTVVIRRRLIWRVGERVSRRDSEEQGTISGAAGSKIKIKWDGGATSYYDREKPGNVRLVKGKISN